MTTNYQNDFYSWTLEQAEAIRSGRIADLDIQNLDKEIESMGRNEKKALEQD